MKIYDVSIPSAGHGSLCLYIVDDDRQRPGTAPVLSGSLPLACVEALPQDRRHLPVDLTGASQRHSGAGRWEVTVVDEEGTIARRMLVRPPFGDDATGTVTPEVAMWAAFETLSALGELTPAGWG